MADVVYLFVTLIGYPLIIAHKLAFTGVHGPGALSRSCSGKTRQNRGKSAVGVGQIIAPSLTLLPRPSHGTT